MPYNEQIVIPDRRLGRMPRTSDTRALLYSKFAQPLSDLPERSDFWSHRTPFRLRSFGNREHGCCTIASQGIMQMRHERLEVRRTPDIEDQEILRVYYAMTFREYQAGDGTIGNPDGDVGAYEVDALNNMRRPELTFRDKQKRPLTIDAFVRVSASDQEQIKNALWTAKTHGLKFCINLPLAFRSLDPPLDWDIPEGQPLTGDWVPGSWGGHSMFMEDFDNRRGIRVPGTWEQEDQWISWRAVAAYVDEVHLCIDSIDKWRQIEGIEKMIDLPGLRQAVNKVSSHKIQ